MKDLQELQLGEGGLAQTDQVSVRQIHYPKVGQLRELEPVKRPLKNNTIMVDCFKILVFSLRGCKQ